MKGLLFSSRRESSGPSHQNLSLHGDEDELVSYKLGQQLFKATNEPKEFFTIRGAHHNDNYDVGGGRIIFKTIRQFIDRYIHP